MSNKKSTSIKTSKAVAKLATGTYYDGSAYDRIAIYMRYPEKHKLDAEDQVIFQRVERAKDLWLQHKEDRLVVNMIIQEFCVSQASAYNYLSDAKNIFALFTSFNPMAELMLLKERIEKAFSLAEKNPKEYGKLYQAAMLAYSEWIKDMRYELERQKPEQDKEIHYHFHTDWSKLPGVTPELMADWNKEFDIMEAKARKKFKLTEEPTDVEYSTGS